MSSFVLVFLGHDLPAYLEDCLFQIRLFNKKTPIFLVIEHQEKQLKRLQEDYDLQVVDVRSLQQTEAMKEFDHKAQLDRAWRGGFWFHVVRRFFFIDMLMKDYHLSDVFHLEYDNTIYFEASKVLSLFQFQFSQMGLVLDNDARCIPGIMYIRHSQAMTQFTQWYVDECLKRTFIDRCLRRKRILTDMDALALFRWKKLKGRQLPLVPQGVLPAKGPAKSLCGAVAKKVREYDGLAQYFGGFFDAAALGQFLGGVDPRNIPGNTQGFMNESCIFSPQVLDLFWKEDEEGRLCPFSRGSDGMEWKVYNLHIHSKNLSLFLSKARQ